MVPWMCIERGSELTPTARWVNVCFYLHTLLTPPWPPPSCLWCGLLSSDAQTVPLACFLPFCSLSTVSEILHIERCAVISWGCSVRVIFLDAFLDRSRCCWSTCRSPVCQLSFLVFILLLPAMLNVRWYVLTCDWIEAILNWLMAREQSRTGISTFSRLPGAQALTGPRPTRRVRDMLLKWFRNNIRAEDVTLFCRTTTAERRPVTLLVFILLPQKWSASSEFGCQRREVWLLWTLYEFPSHPMCWDSDCKALLNLGEP